MAHVQSLGDLTFMALSHTEDGSTEEKPYVPLGDTQPSTTWLPPLRLERQEIFKHPSELKAETERAQTASMASSRTDWAASMASTRTEWSVSKPTTQRSARPGAAGRRFKIDKKFRGKDGSQSARTSKSVGNCPGALGWLYREPENDARRQHHWVKSCPGPERSLREELLTPLRSARGSPRDIFSARENKLDTWLKEVSRYPLSDSLVRAGKQRQERLRELSQATELPSYDQPKPILEPKMSAAASHEQDLLPPETGLEQLEAEPLHDRSRGSRGMQSNSGIFQKLADLARATPFDTVARIKHIAAFVGEHSSTEEERVWMLYCWVCFHISFDCEDFACKSPPHVLPTRIAGSWSMAKLFGALCTELHVCTKVVTGHMRASSNLPGDNICADRSNRHWWNVVLIGNAWTLVDCASGAANQIAQWLPEVRSFRPAFFGSAPEDMAFSHFPAEARWQLLPQPVSYETFMNQVHAAPDAVSASCLEFLPESRPAGTIHLGGSNMGCVHVRMPPGQLLHASLGGEAVQCFVAPQGVRKLNLRITVFGATKLRNADYGGHDLSDPYCICHVPSRDKVLFKTAVHMNRLNPRWNHIACVDDVQPGDDLKFTVMDRDFGSSDDFLGEFTLTTGQFFTGESFESEVALQNDAGNGSKLQLRVETLPQQQVPAAAQDMGGITAVYFRAPNEAGQRQHPLELYTCKAGPSKEPFRRACVFKILTNPDPPDFTEPFFPEVFKGSFHLYGLDFPEALPNGRHVLGAKNEIELCLNKLASAPDGLQVIADVDGNRNAALAHVSGDKVVIRAQAPPGDHVVNVLFRRDTMRQFACAVVYRLHVPENCAEVLTEGFVQVCNGYRELGAVLEAPLSGCLQPGPHRFRFRLPAVLSSAKVVVSVGGKESAIIPHHSDGTFEGDAIVNGSEATLLCTSPDGSVKPLLRWSVANRPTAATPLENFRDSVSVMSGTSGRSNSTVQGKSPRNRRVTAE